VARRQWPVTMGVPFPRGVLHDAEQLQMRADDEPVAGASLPLQTRVSSRWEDGSIRWVLLDWQTDLSARQRRRFRLTAAASRRAPAPHLVVVRDAAGQIEVDTGAVRFVIPKKTMAPFSDVHVDGRPVTSGPSIMFLNVEGQRHVAKAPARVDVLERGPLRARIELRGDYGADFAYVVRVDAFANQPYLRVLHSFEQRGPRPFTPVAQIALEVPMRFDGAVSYRIGQEGGAAWTGSVPLNGVELYQEDNETFHLNGNRQPGRVPGWVDLHDATHGVAIVPRYFWQEYPQSQYVRATGLTYNLWAPEAQPALVGMGAAKTHEMVVHFHGAKQPGGDLLGAAGQPLPVRLPAEWIVASGALPNSVNRDVATVSFLRELEAAHGRFQANASSERWNDSGSIYCSDEPARQRPRRGFYGMFNWGDWNFPGYHDSTKGCDAWGNLEYDTTQVLALGFAATGQPAFFESMVVAARHFMDVDRIHYQAAHPNWVGMNHPKNPLHFSFELGGVDLGHTWTEGLLSYYYFTGDARGLEAARGISDYLVARLAAGVRRGNPRQWGWPQIALVAMYEASGEDGYRSAALEYARRAMRAYPPDDVSHWKMGILAEALTYTHTVTQDPSIRSWLDRYADAVVRGGVSADPRLAPAVAYVGRVTGNPEYRRYAQATVARLQLGGWGKPFTLGGRLGFRILALSAGAAPPEASKAPTPQPPSAAPAAKLNGDTWQAPPTWQPTAEAWHPVRDPFQ
jgi:hypothetical protein